LRVITNRASGLFPAPGEIELSCSCPDSASLCKHLAAVLYGVGARLDTRPELLFLLRGVDHQELVAEAIDAASRGTAGAGGADAGAALTDGDLADVFGIDIGGATEPVAASKTKVVPVEVKVKPLKKVKKVSKSVAVKTTTPAKVVAAPVAKRPRGRPSKVVSAVNASPAPSTTTVSEDLADVMASVKKMQAKPAKKTKTKA
jgi:uncharacterized Zn finger protein